MNADKRRSNLRRLRVTTADMKRISATDLHLRTSQIVREVEKGSVFVIEKRGVPIAELRPPQSLPRTRRLPDREDFIATLPRTRDTGRILEEDRS
jgi:antitoxin (DNA-binding transcriptional repressor) of toxin-antitoxin stability system